MSDADLRREMKRLADRLAAVERRLGMLAEPATDIESTTGEHKPAVDSVDASKAGAFHRLFGAGPVPMALPVESDETASAPVVSVESLSSTAPAPPTPPASAPPTQPHSASTPPTSPMPAVTAAAASDAASAIDLVSLPTALTEARVAAPHHPRPPSKAGPSLEVLIGGKWMAWVGALVVILAAGFAVKVGIDQGLWGRLTPLTRCLVIAGFGGLLLVAGEIALRRIGKAAAAGLISAGLGTLYLDAFATFRGFRPPLLAQEWAFMLMAVVALGGFALTVRTRFLTIGVLSIIGGYVTPILLRGNSTHDVELLLYLTMLLGVSLALSGFMRQPFGALRFVALGCHLAVAFGWLVGNLDRWQMAMCFMSMWWVMIVAESVHTALRNRAAAGNVIMTLIATTAYVTGGCIVLHSSSSTVEGWTGAFTGMVAVIGALACVHFGSGIDALRGWRTQAMDLLSVALWLQFGVLVATAIALQFEHVGQTIGWLLMALTAIEMGRRLPSRGVTIFGLIIGAIATIGVSLRPALGALGSSGQLDPLFDIANFDISTWSLLAIFNVFAMHVGAARLPHSNGWRGARVSLIALASLMWMAIAAHQSTGLVTTAAWLLYAVIVLALDRFAFGRAAGYLRTGLVILACSAGRWLLLDALLRRLDPSWRAGETAVLLNWQMAMAAAIAAAGWWACKLLARREREQAMAGEVVASRFGAGFWQVVLIAGASFGLIAICFEIDRGVSQATLNTPIHVRQLLFTLAWAVGSVVVALIARMIVGGLDGEAAISRTWLLRRFAWSVLGMCAVKWIAWDAPWLLMTDRAAFNTAAPLLNLQMIVGFGLAAAILLVQMIGLRANADRPAAQDGSPLELPRDPASWMPVAAGVIVLWGLSFELDRALAQAAPLPHWLGAFDALQVRALGWTALWAAGAGVMFSIGLVRRKASLTVSGIAIAGVAAIVWLAFDTVSWRVTLGAPAAVAPFVNLQFGVGALCAIVLALVSRGMRAFALRDAASLRSQHARTLARVLLAGVALIGLWLGSIEIDRVFDNNPMVRQAALSAWWALYAVGLVVLGFAKRLAAVRYAGLTLLSLTATKVLIVDLSNLDQLPRVLSFAAAGLLLILTSVVYAKLSPRLLGEQGDRGTSA